MPNSNSNFMPGSLLDNHSPDHFLLLNNPRTLSSIDTQAPAASRNSSLQKVWAEDYYNIDYSSEGDHTAQGLREGVGEHPPASQPFPGSIPFEEELDTEPARPSRTHQRSLTSLLPFRSPTKSKSPERRCPQKSPKQDVDDFMPTFTGDKEGTIKVADKSKGIGSWFAGSSAPIALGISEETLQPNIQDASPERGKLKKKPTAPPADLTSGVNTTPVKATAASRFTSFWSPKTLQSNTVQVPVDLNDEIMNLDIDAALFPPGTDQDSLSPAAFLNLKQNAKGLLSKMQNAYKLRTVELHEAEKEEEAMAEELEEAQTRNNLLKANLADMAHQVSDRDSTIKDLLNELTMEKRARADEKEARERSIAMVTERARRDAAKRGSTSDLSIDTTAEDLGFATARWKRQSGGSDFTGADSDAESGAEESTFSRARSPVHSMTGTLDTTPGMTPEIMQASFGRMVPNPTHSSGFEKRPKMVQQKSTFQKVLGKITTPDETAAPVLNRDPYGGLGLGEEGCSNCRGRDSSVAWDTVGLMRAENQCLKGRVGELEKAIDDTLEMSFMIGLKTPAVGK